MRNWSTLKNFQIKETSLKEWTDKYKLRKATFKIYNWYVTLRWTASRNGKTIYSNMENISGKYFLIWKIWAMNIWGNQNLNIIFYYARKKNSLITIHKAILLHITGLRFCHINGSLMGHPHLKDRCVLICVILRNTAGSGNYLSGL